MPRRRRGSERHHDETHVRPASCNARRYYGDQGEAAQKAVDFLLSEEGQSYFVKETHGYPLVDGVERTDEDLPAVETLKVPDIDLGELDSLEETLKMLKDVGMV